MPADPTPDRPEELSCAAKVVVVCGRGFIGAVVGGLLGLIVGAVVGLLDGTELAMVTPVFGTIGGVVLGALFGGARAILSFSPSKRVGP